MASNTYSPDLKSPGTDISMLELGLDPDKHVYKNQLGRISTHKMHASETYLSSTRFKPRKLVVQASRYNVRTEGEVDWKRQKITGSVPTALRISEWTLRPAFAKEAGVKRIRLAGIPSTLLRTMLVAFPLQVYMALPMFTAPWDEDDAEGTYGTWPGYNWKWPKYAVNPLDMAPSSEGLAPRVLSAIPRLLRPRVLMVFIHDRWVRKDMDADPAAEIPYVMVSYANRHFHTDIGRHGEPASLEGQQQLRHIAQHHAKRLGVAAYWLDFECRASRENEELLDSDVNRFCDVVRGSRAVIIALPDHEISSALEWGSRMWTLPEALLAPDTRLTLHYANTNETTVRTKIEMANLAWRNTSKPRDGRDGQATRMLAEHFMGTLHMSRLQLIATVLVALWDRKADDMDQHRPGELAHAAMGLFHTRLDPVPGNTLFQDIAKLSLLNDSDRLIERMVCLLPVTPVAHQDGAYSGGHIQADPFYTMQQADEFNTHLWDIHPTCDVVGVAEEDRTLILNNCRAVAIRWKTFPRILWKKSPSFKKFLAEMFLRSGTYWITVGFTLAYTYSPLWAYSKQVLQGDDPKNTKSLTYLLVWAVLFFWAVGVLLSWLGPISLRILYGGIALQPAPHLVAFEGTMPIGKLEAIIFGNYDNRLKYEPSSTEFSKDSRHPTDRISTEPEWVTKSQPPPRALKSGHRIFTLVDTGNLSVSLFQARRPPTVALICGREGGMLRTLLCSWKPEADCLYKETVVRMPTETYAMASPKGWLKLQLGRAELGRPKMRKSGLFKSFLSGSSGKN